MQCGAIIGKHQRMFAILVLKEIVNPFFCRQAMNKIEIAFSLPTLNVNRSPLAFLLIPSTRFPHLLHEYIPFNYNKKSIDI